MLHRKLITTLRHIVISTNKHDTKFSLFPYYYYVYQTISSNAGKSAQAKNYILFSAYPQKQPINSGHMKNIFISYGAFAVSIATVSSLSMILKFTLKRNTRKNYPQFSTI